ncbi:MAG TPA: DUF2330 domain-containing protein [Polyangiaceae bacterium]|jgi:hypothetical protein
MRFALAAVALAFVLAPRDARACATAGGAFAIPIQREDALIVWDEAHHEEYFIRSAEFDTTSKSFGFLVPTPTQPTFGEVGDAWVEALRGATAPRVLDTYSVSFVAVGCTRALFANKYSAASASADGQFGGGVSVLATTHVAGLDVAVLDASDADALAHWLAAHDFTFRDALKRWVTPYLAKKWKISAFRYVRPDLASDAPMWPAPIASRAVRISFATDAPVYPYREPDDAASVSNRELHLFVISPSRVAGAESDLANAAWTAALPFAASVATPPGLASALAGVDLPHDAWINEFVDSATKRAETDLVFERAATADEVRRPALIHEHVIPAPVPYELVLLAVPLGAVWLRRRLRARRAAN